MIKNLLLASSLALGCASSAPPTETASEQVRFSDDELAKLDAPLRTRVRDSDESERIPITVVFRSMPRQDALLELLLVRQGDRAVGQVTVDVIKEIASRDDVLSVRYVDGASYSS